MADIAIVPRRAKTEIREANAWDQLKHNRNWLGFWFMVPALAFLIFFLAYPLGLGIWISFTDTRIGRIGHYIGLENYEWLQDDPIFPPMVGHMVRIGEETGELEKMLGKIADFYEDEVDTAIASLTAIIEPLMMIGVGAMVGVIIISMYLPMFKLLSLVK